MSPAGGLLYLGYPILYDLTHRIYPVCGAEQLLTVARDSIGGKSLQPLRSDHWIIRPVRFLITGSFFIQAVGLMGGMYT